MDFPIAEEPCSKRIKIELLTETSMDDCGGEALGVGEGADQVHLQSTLVPSYHIDFFLYSCTKICSWNNYELEIRTNIVQD